MSFWFTQSPDEIHILCLFRLMVSWIYSMSISTDFLGSLCLVPQCLESLLEHPQIRQSRSHFCGHGLL